MAYNTKYRFRFDSANGVVYEVRLLENGYSGSVTDRPLGAAPVIRMQEATPFLPTSCDLVLECRTDGEYVDLYTTDPMQYKVEVYQKKTSSYSIIWEGFVATELYSEPDIAPPYDVKITATDGLGILKEYTFEAAGSQTLRRHLQDLLRKAGDSRPYIYVASQLREYGESAADFLDNAQIDLDFLAGESCYDVLGKLLTSMRCVITYQGYWLIIRDVDVQLTSAGILSVLSVPVEPDESTTTDTLSQGKTVGQMGVAQMWPVGFLTRRVSPAKKSVKVRSQWHWKNGFPKVEEDGWGHTGYVTFDSTYKNYHIGQGVAATLANSGTLAASVTMLQFVTNFRVKVKVSAHTPYSTGGINQHYIKIKAAWTENGTGTVYYYAPSTGWSTSSGADGETKMVEDMNPDHDPNACAVIEASFPALMNSNSGFLTVNVDGYLVDVYDIEVVPETIPGYEDHILIDNGARGEAPMIDLAVCRVLPSNFVKVDFMQGIFWALINEGGYTVIHPIMAFSDGSNTNKDFMSLAALAYAKEHAAPRIEITGKLDNPAVATMLLPPMFVKSHGVWARLSSYDWNLKEEDIDFKALTLPTATLTVDSETITSIPNK